MRLYTDIDPYCCEVIRARIADGQLPGGVVLQADIRELDQCLIGFDHIHLFAGIGASALGLKWAGWPDDTPIVTGGWPCQDISDAGLRAGLSGARSGLYRELMRCLRLVPRAYALLENVAALLRRGMGSVLGELAEQRRDAEWDCIPSASIGATHLRRRVWIAVLPSNAGGVRPQGFRPTTKESGAWEQLARLVQAELRVSVPAGSGGGVADGISKRMDRLSALGNAQDPRVVEVVGRAMVEAIRE